MAAELKSEQPFCFSRCQFPLIDLCLSPQPFRIWVHSLVLWLIQRYRLWLDQIQKQQCFLFEQQTTSGLASVWLSISHLSSILSDVSGFQVAMTKENYSLMTSGIFLYWAATNDNLRSLINSFVSFAVIKAIYI